MPCFMYIDGRKQEMDEDIFDQMVEALHQPDIQESPIQTSTRWKPDGTYDKKPLDPEYFPKHYHEKLSTPFQCPQFHQNHIYQNTATQKFVFTTDAIVKTLNSNLNPKNSNRQPTHKNY